MPALAARVVYVANGANVGGGARVLIQAMLGLAPRFTPHLVVPAEGTFSAWASAHGVPWSLAPHGGRNAISGRAATYRNALHLARVARGAAVIHAEAVTCYPPVGLVGRVLGIPRICHVQFPPSPGELTYALRYGADLVLTVYRKQADEIRSDVRSDIPVLAVPNGIEVDHYVSTEDDPAARALREDASHVAAIVAHVSEVKGYPTFLEAAARVLTAYPHALFLCAGGETTSQGYTDSMRRLARDLGISARVRFLGAVADVRPVLRAADLFVLPSEQEGLPLAALEAMSCGRAVVSTPVNGVPEAVLDGTTGLLVPPRDPRRLADAIFALFADAGRRNAMGQAGLRRVREHFEVNRVQRDLNTVYGALADGARGTALSEARC